MSRVYELFCQQFSHHISDSLGHTVEAQVIGMTAVDCADIPAVSCKKLPAVNEIYIVVANGSGFAIGFMNYCPSLRCVCPGRVEIRAGDEDYGRFRMGFPVGFIQRPVSRLQIVFIRSIMVIVTDENRYVQRCEIFHHSFFR